MSKSQRTAQQRATMTPAPATPEQTIALAKPTYGSQVEYLREAATSIASAIQGEAMRHELRPTRLSAEALLTTAGRLHTTCVALLLAEVEQPTKRVRKPRAKPVPIADPLQAALPMGVSLPADEALPDAEEQGDVEGFHRLPAEPAFT